MFAERTKKRKSSSLGIFQVHKGKTLLRLCTGENKAVPPCGVCGLRGEARLVKKESNQKKGEFGRVGGGGGGCGRVPGG